MKTRISKWLERVSEHPWQSFWIAFILFIIAAIGVRLSSACLYTPLTPRAIVDLELAFDQSEALTIKEFWSTYSCGHGFSISSNGLEAATVNIILDFPFIAAYRWFLIVLFTISKNGYANLRVAGFAIAMVFASLDVIENLFMLIFLRSNSIPSMLFAVPATLKFTVILFFVAWILVRLSISLFLRIRS